MTTVRYSEIVQSLQSRRGDLREPLRLPAEDVLAEEHSVARDTVRRALRVLEDDGAVTRRRGRGTYLQPIHISMEGLAGRTVGFVPPFWADSVSDGYTARVFAGVARWADERDCRLAILHAQEKPDDVEQWYQRVRDRKLAAIVWVHPRKRQLPLVQHIARQWPTVILGRHYPESGLHHVLPDYEQAARLIDRCLVNHGHREYALVSVDNLEVYSSNWVRAVEAAHARRGVEFDTHRHLVDVAGFDRHKLGDLLLDFCQPAHPLIQAYVFTTSSLLSPLITNDRFRKRMEQGRVSVATMDFGLYPMEAYWPGHTISHATCDWARLGRLALETLSLLCGGHEAPRVLREPVEFQAGQTVFDWQALPSGQREQPHHQEEDRS